ERTDLELPVAPDAPALPVGPERGSVFERFILLAEHKAFIFGFAGIAAVIAAVVAFFVLPKVYEANTKIIPPQQNPSMAIAMLAQLGPLAAVAGNQLGLRSPGDLYVDMLRSRTVADDLIQRFSLMQHYRKKKLKDARKRLEDRTEIVAAKDGVISVTVTDRDPQLAADLANAYIEELEKLTQTLAVTEAGRRRLFFEREV